MAIVKVMKARRRMKFEALVNEVGQLLRNFQPSVRVIAVNYIAHKGIDRKDGAEGLPVTRLQGHLLIPIQVVMCNISMGAN